MKVIIIDESPIAVLGATTILLRAGINVIGTSTQLGQLSNLLGSRSCDLALIEPFTVGIAHDESLHTLANAMATRPSVAVTALTDLSDPDTAGTLVAMGVRGIVDKRAPWTEIPAAIYATASGGTYRTSAHVADSAWRQRRKPRTTSTS